MLVRMRSRRRQGVSGPCAAPGARAARASLVALVALSAGCYDGHDPLDPERLAEITRRHGDAVGIEMSGVYEGSVELLECGCEDVVAARAVSLCWGLEQLELFGRELSYRVHVVQADGSVRIQPTVAMPMDPGDDPIETTPLTLTMYGPLQADGALMAAGVLQVDQLLAEGRILGRVDGTLTGPDQEWALMLEVQQRYQLELASGLSTPVLDFGETTLESVDCREHLALDLRWLGPLPDPE